MLLVQVPNSPGETETAAISLQDLTNKFGTATVTSVMQCAGNRAADDIAAQGECGECQTDRLVLVEWTTGMDHH